MASIAVVFLNRAVTELALGYSFPQVLMTGETYLLCCCLQLGCIIRAVRRVTLAAISVLYRLMMHCGSLYLVLNIFMAVKAQGLLHLVEKPGVCSAVCIMTFGAGFLYRLMNILSVHLLLYQFMTQEAQVIAGFYQQQFVGCGVGIVTCVAVAGSNGAVNMLKL